MAKREHGYIALVPVFIPVDKNDTENQIAVMRAVLSASRGGNLEDITSLPGVRLNVKPGKVIVNRWTSIERVEAGEAEPEQPTEEEPALDPTDLPADPAADEPAADPEATTGRRRRAA